MKATVLGIVACALLIAAFAVFAPATLVDRRLAAVSGGKLRVLAAEGTVWRGRGALGDAAGTWRLPVAWTVDATALARGTLAVALAPAEGATSPRGRIDATGDALALRDTVVDVPAGALASVLPARIPLALGGTITLTAADFAAAAGGFRGQIGARWRDARVVAAGIAVNLGAVDLALAPQGERLAGRVTNAGGDVRIDGTVTIARDSAGIDATLAPQSSAAEPVARALAALGTPDGAGGVRVTWRGALR